MLSKRSIPTKNSVGLRVFSVFLCVILQICFLNSAKAQVFPISVNTQLIPPYSVDLVNYAAPGCEQLRVMITQLNLTQSYSIRLHMDIQLNGKTIIRTSPQYAPPPILLSPGQTLIISGSDLYPYLDPQNMDFVGYSRENYMRTKCLPEGFYTITFTAINYEPPYKVLSQGGSMYCYLAKADPPQLNLPFNNASVAALASQFVNFQWLPRNIASPNATQSTTYRLELFEIRPAGRNPNDIVQSTQPIFTSETTLANLNYTIADPHLEIGMRYAWRVRATEGSGLDRIRNNGYSEVYSFTYGGDAANQPGSKVENFRVEAVAPTRAKLTWDPSTDFDGYKTRYRKSGGNFIWYEDETVKNSFDIFKLTPQETYEFQVQGRKGTIWGGFSDSKTIKMPACQDIKCGDPYTAPNITNRKPLDELRPLQEINAGGFYTTVLKATGANGRFTGDGFTVVPLFENRKISCSFKNILVNTDYQLVEGQIVLETSWNDSENNIYNANQVTEGKEVKVVTGYTGGIIILPDVSIPDAQAITLDTANNDLVIVSYQGDTLRLDVTAQMEDTSIPTLMLQDKDGNLYSVNKETGETVAMGKVGTSNIQLSDSQKKKIAGDRAIVYFEAIPGETKYAFDIRNKAYARSNIIMDSYRTLENPGSSPYDIPFKLIPVGASDVVKVRVAVTENGFKEENIRFITGTGSELTKDKDDKLTLPSGQDNDGIEIYAVYPQKGDPSQYDVLGKLIVISHTVKTSKVILVPVNGSKLDEAKIKEELDKIYIPVAINWQVTTDESNFEASVDNLNVEGSGLFSMYSPEMRSINDAFKQQCENFDPSAVYLFIIKGSAGKGLDGDMPRSKQFGYIFTNGSDKDYRAVAHELAHGIFHLQHTFSTDYKIDEKSTSNLMDYDGGTDLIKHQWDGIHSPGLVIGMFESDEGGESRVKADILGKLAGFKNTQSNSYTFLTPTGKVITLPAAGLTSVIFYDDAIHKKQSADQALYIPVGTLAGFTLNGKEYLSNANQNLFLGYRNTAATENEKWYTDINSKLVPAVERKVIFAFPCVENICESQKVSDIKLSLKANYINLGSDFSWPVENVTYGQEEIMPENIPLLEDPINPAQSVLLEEWSDFTDNFNKPAIEFLASNITCSASSFNNTILRIANYINNDKDGIYESFTGCCGHWLYKPELKACFSNLIKEQCSEINEISTPEEYVASIKTYYGKLIDQKVKLLTNNYDLANWTGSANELIDYLNDNICSDIGYKALSLDSRLKILTVLGDQDNIKGCWFSAERKCAEGQIIDVLNYAPKEDYAGIIKFFRQNLNRFFHLYNSIDNHGMGAYNFDSFVEAVAKIALYVDQANILDFDGPEKNNIIIYANAPFDNTSGLNAKTRYFSYSLLEDKGKINIYTFVYEFAGKNITDESPKTEFDPFETVVVIARDKYSRNIQTNVEFEEGEIYMLPAFVYHAMEKSINNKQIVQNIKLGVSSFLIPFSIATAITSGSTLGMLLNFTDAVGITYQTIVDQGSFLEKIKGTYGEGSTAFKTASTVNAFYKIYFCVRIGQAAVGILRASAMKIISLSQDEVVFFKNTYPEFYNQIENARTASSKFLNIAPNEFASIDELGNISINKLAKTYYCKNLDIKGIVFNTGDGYVDVIVHSKDGGYVISIDNIEYIVNESSLSQIINKNIPSDKTIRLLSCSDLNSAKTLSGILKNREIIASDGIVKLYSDGTVASGKWYKIKGETQTEVSNFTPSKESTDLTAYIKLGEEAAKGGDIITLPSKAPDPNALPKGSKTIIKDNMSPENQASLMRENEGADILAKKGYDIEQNPIVSNSIKKPDYKIEDEIFDCYAPYNSNKPVRGIWDEIKIKVDEGQTERVFLHLKNWEGNILDLQKQFDDYPITGLKEVMILYKNNEIIHLTLK